MSHQDIRARMRSATLSNDPQQPHTSQSSERIFAMPSISSPAPSVANTGAWLSFVYLQFGVAAGMTALGIFFMPVDLIVKGYLMMSSLFLIGSTFTLAKTVRDEHEARRLSSRIEDARAERLLMEVGRS
jgi:hypothetical protein